MERRAHRQLEGAAAEITRGADGASDGAAMTGDHDLPRAVEVVVIFALTNGEPDTAAPAASSTRA
jgi:ribosomal protein S10